MALLALAFALALAPQGADPARDFLLTEKDAIMLGPAEVAGDSIVQSLKWSADGKYLAMQRMAVGFNSAAMAKMLAGEDPGVAFKPQNELIVWNAVTKTTRKLISLPAREASFRAYEWMGNSHSLVAHFDLQGNEDEVWLLSATGNPRKITTIDASSGFELTVSRVLPVAALAAFSFEPNSPATVRFVDATGRLSNDFTVPKLAGLFRWSVDGTKFYVRSMAKPDNLQGALPPGWYSMDRFTGQLTKTDGADMAAEPKPSLFQVRSSTLNLSGRGDAPALQAPVSTLWATNMDPKEPSYAVVSSDGTMAAIAPDNSAVAFVSQGVALVRPMLRMPKEAYLKAKNDAERTVVLSKAKQVGTALIMLAYDNNETFPGAEGWQDKVDPYLKNRGLTSGFNYTYSGGRMSEIADPASTVLGFLSGPGGRAVVYADGHVKWEKD